MEDKLQALATLIHDEYLARLTKTYPTYAPGWESDAKVTVTRGPKYTRLDVGTSGKYMVDNATGEVFGIKGYGVVHRGHRYGTLDTINEWYWGEYTASKRKVTA